MSDKISTPWIEKYRPTSIDQVELNRHILQTLKNLIKANKIPHLLFYGPPGTGKTSTILACTNELYENQTSSFVIHLNASDERGIDVVRERIRDFCNAGLLFVENKKKLVILDEADSMTQDAQLALRQMIVKYTKNVRFCLICNYVYKIIPELQSRFSKFRFKILDNKLITSKISYILKKENIDYDLDTINILSKNCNGDMRKIINTLQCICINNQKIDSQTLSNNIIYLNNQEVDDIINNLLNKSLKENITIIDNLVSKNCLLDNIIEKIVERLFSFDISDKRLIYLVEKISNLQSSIVDNKVLYLVSIFISMRQLI